MSSSVFGGKTGTFILKIDERFTAKEYFIDSFFGFINAIAAACRSNM